MSRLFLAFALCIVECVCAQIDKDVIDAMRNGAEAKYVYRVIDDMGMPVSNATARVWFSSYGRPQDNANWTVKTDTNGMFTVKHRFNERFSVGIDKDGYYHTNDEIFYLGMSRLPVKEGKWQPYGEMRVVVLKKMRNPITMSHKDHCLIKVPTIGVWLGFDLEHQEFVKPYGGGHVSDMLLRFNVDVINSQTNFTATMDVCFTNNVYGGMYICKKDSFSEMESDYIVDTNANFMSAMTFTLKREGRLRTEHSLSKESYLVFRTRTKVDALGRLVSANYGKIYGRWGFYGGMSTSGIWFNPISNDLNLEDEYTANLSRERRSQQERLIRERHKNVNGSK